MHFELNQQVGNYKTGRVGKIASPLFKGAHGEFEGFVVLTDYYGYEVWMESSVVLFPPEFVRPETQPTA